MLKVGCVNNSNNRTTTIETLDGDNINNNSNNLGKAMVAITITELVSTINIEEGVEAVAETTSTTTIAVVVVDFKITLGPVSAMDVEHQITPLPSALSTR